jgi:energy-coupling factor transporter transmembrane protein EcfT
VNRFAAWSVVAAMAGASLVALLAPWPVVGAFAIVAIVALRQRRAAFLVYSILTVALYAVLLATLAPGSEPWLLGPLRVGREGLQRGLVGGLRLSTILGANLAILSRRSPQHVLDGLRLPRRATAFLGAVLLAAHDLGRDGARLATARRLDGAWPRRRTARIRAVASLTAPLAVRALHRGRTRADALRLAGVDTPPSFAPLVAITALAMAGRLALVALPNVSLAYVVVFAGGYLFGGRIGFWSGLLAMLLTDFLLSGVHVVALANAPAMGLLGLLGGAMRTMPFHGDGAVARWTGRLTAATLGILGTLLFSVAADVLTWLAVAEYRGQPGALQALLLAGLAFNVVPAATNALLFAAALRPLSAARRSGLSGLGHAGSAESRLVPR